MDKSRASRITDKLMEHDAFSRWLGIERLEEKEGYCRLRMTVREDMCNGFGIAHGGICYSLADSALAFASNSRGRHALSIETSISHTRPLKPGDIIIATATEQSSTQRLASYYVDVRKSSGDIAALFRGTVLKTEKEWEV